MTKLTKARIRKLFSALNEELAKENVIGEVYLVGGAVMCLALNARPSTLDLDAYFEPKELVRQAAIRVAQRERIDERWLNDAVKGLLIDRGTFNPYLSLSNLRVFLAQSEYLLAMKSLSFRIGPEFTDEADVRFLLRNLNIETFDDALKIIERYYSLDRLPQKTFYALKEILG
jgi:hypothetical protein